MSDMSSYMPNTLSERVKNYDEAWNLKKSTNLSVRQISHKLDIPLGTLCHWFYRSNHPLGWYSKFVAKSSAELAYVIGAVLGDGCLFKRKNGGCSIILNVMDKDFMDAYVQAVSKVLNKTLPLKPWITKDKHWRVEPCSKFLYNFLNRSLEKLEPFIKAHPEAFLRGLYDAEGSSYVEKAGYLRVSLSNTNQELIMLTKKTLEDLGFHPTLYYRPSHHGEYTLRIAHQHECHRFMKEVGFSIQRKMILGD